VVLKHFAKFSLPNFFEATLRTVLAFSACCRDEVSRYEMDIVLCSEITCYFFLIDYFRSICIALTFLVSFKDDLVMTKTCSYV
jgi:hypothetical protein